MSNAHHTPASRLLASAGILAVVAAIVVSGTALAARSGAGSTTSSVRLVLLDGTDAIANHGERASFAVSTSASRPFVGVRCYQAGDFVLDGYTGYFEGYAGNPWVVLGSPYMSPAATADCTARLFYYDKRGNQRVLATTDFTVYP
ncbi:MAG TPA: hypothetical protein VFY23_13685 [Candidatus Limnocylindrales bacterium]|nr:hypothetical protein [Candidatus Limnocylindrales bacterium]